MSRAGPDWSDLMSRVEQSTPVQLSRRGRHLITLIGLGLTCLATAKAHEGHAPLPSNGATLDGENLLVSDPAIKAIGLQTGKISLSDLHHTLDLNARVELPWSAQAKVVSPLPGRVVDVRVKPGEPVRAGQELATVESVDLEALQAQMLGLQTELTLLRRVLEQRTNLASSKAIRATMLLETQTELANKTLEQEIVRLKLRGWGLSVESIADVLASESPVQTISLVSPLDGIVGQVAAVPGQSVDTTVPLFEVLDLSRVYVLGEALEADSHLVQPGQTATVSFASLPGSAFVGQVDHVHLHVHQPQRMVHVAVTVDNPEGLLRPGMFGRMEVTVASAEQAILCPLSAVIETEQGAFVLKREGPGKFRRHPVQLGMRSGEHVVVEKGLFPGQEVVVTAAHLLASMFDAVQGGSSRSGSSQGSIPSSIRRGTVTAASAEVELPTGSKVTATSLIEGRLQDLHVRPGEVIEAGQVLATLRSQPLRDLQLDLLAASVRSTWADKEVRRLRPLVEAGAVPGKDLWQRETDLKTAQQQIASLSRRLTLIGIPDQQIEQIRTHATLDAARSEVAELPLVDTIEIRSPIAGRVADAFLVPGELVHAHDRIVEVQNLDQLWIRAYVREGEAQRVQPGHEAIVTFPANPNLRVHGKIVRTAPALSVGDRVLPLWIEVSNPESSLREGMLARVTIDAPLVERPVTIRRAAQLN